MPPLKLLFKLPQPAVVIFEYLSEMPKFVYVHPVITQMEPLGNNCYRVHETLRWCGVPISFTYPVHVEHNKAAGRITMQATVLKLIHINLQFSIRTESGLTVVEETVTIKTRFPIQRMMKNIFRTQHTLLFKNLEALQH